MLCSFVLFCIPTKVHFRSFETCSTLCTNERTNELISLQTTDRRREVGKALLFPHPSFFLPSSRALRTNTVVSRQSQFTASMKYIGECWVEIKCHAQQSAREIFGYAYLPTGGDILACRSRFAPSLTPLLSSFLGP